MRRGAMAMAWVVLAACGGGDSVPEPLSPTDPAEVLATLDDLAALGEKRIGTPAHTAARDYLRDHMTSAGLVDVHFESYRLPIWELADASVAVTIDGVPLEPAPGFDVFYGSGAGTVDAEIVWADAARDEDLAGLDVTGKVAMVRRLRSFHRSSQFRNLVEAGAVAMLYISAADDNLRQVGSVTPEWEVMGAIPAVTIGNDDGAMLRESLTAGQTLRAVIDVDAATGTAVGDNVVGRIEGEGPEQIVVGAHYDTWFTGSADNGSGVAALLALAARRARQPKPRYTIVFVGYGVEETSLYGGYHFLREHRVVNDELLLAVINFEMPSATDTTLFGIARSEYNVLDDALRWGGLNFLYPLYVTLDVVPTLFGGIIPTDIQGIYRAGIPTVSTAVDSPYYHTTADTPERVDVELLAQAVDAFDLAFEPLLDAEPSAFAGVDSHLWTATATQRPRSSGQPLVIDVQVADAAGTAQADTPVDAILMYDDFFIAATTTAVADATGAATLQFEAADAERGDGDRFVHVTAGRDFPLVERVIAVEPAQ